MEFGTQRLVIRPFGSADAEAFASLQVKIGANPYLRHCPPVKSFDEWKNGFLEAIEKPMSNLRSGCVGGNYLRENGELIGRCALDKRGGALDLTVVLDPTHTRVGLGTELTTGLLSYGFYELRAEKIAGRVHPENTPSIRLCQKLGFELEGVVGDVDLNYSGFRIYALKITKWSTFRTQ